MAMWSRWVIMVVASVDGVMGLGDSRVGLGEPPPHQGVHVAGHRHLDDVAHLGKAEAAEYWCLSPDTRVCRLQLSACEMGPEEVNDR